MKTSTRILLSLGTAFLFLRAPLSASPGDDARAVGELDNRFQAAVKGNDAATMDAILADDMILVTGRGHTFTKAQQLEESRHKGSVYEHQEEEAGTQKVRVWGDTAVVTALLWIKGVQSGKPIEYRLWFSDVYLRTLTGWRYTFGQASLALPPVAK